MTKFVRVPLTNAELPKVAAILSAAVRDGSSMFSELRMVGNLGALSIEGSEADLSDLIYFATTNYRGGLFDLEHDWLERASIATGAGGLSYFLPDQAWVPR